MLKDAGTSTLHQRQICVQVSFGKVRTSNSLLSSYSKTCVWTIVKPLAFSGGCYSKQLGAIRCCACDGDLGRASGAPHHLIFERPGDGILFSKKKIAIRNRVFDCILFFTLMTRKIGTKLQTISNKLWRHKQCPWVCWSHFWHDFPSCACSSWISRCSFICVCRMCLHRLPQIIWLVVSASAQVCVWSVEGFRTCRFNHVPARNVMRARSYFSFVFLLSFIYY